MTAAIRSLRAPVLLAGLLAALLSNGGRVEAQTVQIVPLPDIGVIEPPVLAPVQIYLFDPRPGAPAPAPRPLVCPRHTKWRVDCTPVPQQ